MAMKIPENDLSGHIHRVHFEGREVPPPPPPVEVPTAVQRSRHAEQAAQRVLADVASRIPFGAAPPAGMPRALAAAGAAAATSQAVAVPSLFDPSAPAGGAS